jgi:hypothetical protein
MCASALTSFFVIQGPTPATQVSEDFTTDNSGRLSASTLSAWRSSRLSFHSNYIHCCNLKIRAVSVPNDFDVGPSPYMSLLHRIVFRDAFSRHIFSITSYPDTSSFKVGWGETPSSCFGSLPCLFCFTKCCAARKEWRLGGALVRSSLSASQHSRYGCRGSWMRRGLHCGPMGLCSGRHKTERRQGMAIYLSHHG